MDKRILLPLVILPAFQTGNMQAADQPAKRPNIILFMVDDMGWEDTSLPFWTEKTHYNEVYETPNMERLARQGVMFTQAYASSISSPSRCSLITGTNAARHRVTNWTLQKDKTTDRKDSLLDIPDWNYNGVSQVTGTNNTFVGTSFVQLLKNSGYHTIHCGKAHFGAIDTPGEDPHHWGFEVNIAGHAAGGLASYLGEENYGHTKDGKPTSLMSIPGLEKYWGTETFATEALTLEAIKALDKAKKYNQPFYLYMSHYAIHIPLNKDMRFYEKYKKKGMTDHEAAYATLIEGMDKSLGDLMDWLEKNGEADNTIILFMSDNGGLASTSEWRDGPLYTQNYPLLSGKGSLCRRGYPRTDDRQLAGSSPTEYPLRQIPADRRLLPDYPGNGRSEGLRDGATYRRHQLRSSAHRDGRSFQRAFPLLEYAEQLGQRRSGHQLQLCGPQWRLETDLLLRYRQERTVQHLRRYRRKERP